MNVNDLFILADKEGVIEEVFLDGMVKSNHEYDQVDIDLYLEYKTEAGYKNRAYIFAAQIGGDIENIASMRDNKDRYIEIAQRYHESRFELAQELLRKLPAKRLFGLDTDEIQGLSDKTKMLIGEDNLKLILDISTKLSEDRQQFFNANDGFAFMNALINRQQEGGFHLELEDADIPDLLKDVGIKLGENMEDSMFEEYEYSIAKHYVTALEYGDYSGLSDSEEAELEEFLKTLPEGPSHWDWGESIDETSFQKDEISGLMADCVDAKLMVNKRELKKEDPDQDASRRRGNRPGR